MGEDVESVASVSREPIAKIEYLMDRLWDLNSVIWSKASDGIEAREIGEARVILFNLMSRARDELGLRGDIVVPSDPILLSKLIDETLMILQKKGFYPLKDEDMPF